MPIPWGEPAATNRLSAGRQSNGLVAGTLSEVVAFVWRQTVTGDGWVIWLDDESRRWEGREIVELYAELPDGPDS